MKGWRTEEGEEGEEGGKEEMGGFLNKLHFILLQYTQENVHYDNVRFGQTAGVSSFAHEKLSLA